MLGRWVNRQLENERQAALYHLMLAGFGTLGVVYHLAWAARRHWNHHKQIRDPHKMR